MGQGDLDPNWPFHPVGGLSLQLSPPSSVYIVAGSILWPQGLGTPGAIMNELNAI